MIGSMADYSQEQTIFCLNVISISKGLLFLIYRVYKKKRNLGISQEIDIVLKTKDFRRLGI
jgi:hypothetical protein